MIEQIDKTLTHLQIINKKLEKLQTLSNRPKALRLYEPRIQKVYVSINNKNNNELRFIP